MAILTDPPEWRVPGPKPPPAIIEDLGWEVGSHPPAPWFNWFFHRVFESLLELEAATLARVINESGVPGMMAGPENERPAPSPETAGRLYIATDTRRIYRDRGTTWDRIGVATWDDLENKPSQFPPGPHASSHAIGGADELTPADIGAETPAGAQAKADAALAAARAYAVSKSGDTMQGDLAMASHAVTFGGRFRLVYNSTLNTLDIEVIT
ncbi:MAG: hypothetical protein BAA04_01505 [Firmicutes bacterium ZCTH02-B6]|nr:MAG: hypothetical protein BAA04_01505 [Firmicutes bacterium ZCTH02-B6]